MLLSRRQTAGIAACGALFFAGTAAATPLFTGNVPSDFAEPGTVVIADATGIDVGVPTQLPEGTISGNDLEDIRLYLDPAEDVLSVGFNTYGIAGDVDGDGDPGATDPALETLGGEDIPDFGGSESFVLLIDVDEDGIFDAAAGVPVNADVSGYTVATFVGAPSSPGLGFGATLPDNVGLLFGSPNAGAPDLEFTITNFSWLPTSSGSDQATSIGVLGYIGSSSDAGIGEDLAPGKVFSIDVCFDLDEDGYSSCALGGDPVDCDDEDPDAYPGALEACNNVDDDCDGRIDENFDRDGDGYAWCGPDTGSPDCDDWNPYRGPQAIETCNHIDDNCDGQIDEGFDKDLDGFDSCGGDCNDNNGTVYPGAEEVCNLIDDDCDAGQAGGGIDEGFDLDGDGFTVCNGDCEDANAAIKPIASELCNGIDDDCDGLVDDRPDRDADGFTDCADCDDWNPARSPAATEYCNGSDDNCDGVIDEGYDKDGDGYKTCSGDCNDTNAAIYPGAAETCNKIDDNCNGATDEGFDGDGDGFTYCSGDCDDGNPAIKPTASEVCNGIDDDCDGVVDESPDRDGDGYTECDHDCDDWNLFRNPGVTETCNGVDDNCDGLVDEGFDQDGDGYTTCRGDCNDADASVSPSSAETCNQVDDNCNGTKDEGFDLDSDGYSTCSNGANVLDCDDTSAAIKPSAIETCNGVDDNCDGKADEGLLNACGECGPTPDEVCDSVDNNCDGTVDEGLLNACGECGPTPDEVCDGVDNDCDGKADEGFDQDADGYTSCGEDCNDSDSTVSPATTETCNGIDDNCDGLVDDDDPAVTDLGTFYPDDDADGFGTDEPPPLDPVTTAFPAAPSGNDVYDYYYGYPYMTYAGDRYTAYRETPGLPAVDTLTFDVYVDQSYLWCYADLDFYFDGQYLGAVELNPSYWYSELQGTIEVDTSETQTHEISIELAEDVYNWECYYSIVMLDVSYSTLTMEYAHPETDPVEVSACQAPAGYVENADDCDDLDPLTNPMADEVCDGRDNDCDGQIDEEDSVDAQTWYEDLDWDGYGDPSTATASCTAPSGYVANGDDCDDGNWWVYPYAYEYWDGVDNDCDGQVDESSGGGKHGSKH